VKQLSLPPTGQSFSVDSNTGPKSSQAAPSQQSGSGTTSMTSSQGFLKHEIRAGDYSVFRNMDKKDDDENNSE
jgi:hypothetical protein